MAIPIRQLSYRLLQRRAPLDEPCQPFHLITRVRPARQTLKLTDIDYPNGHDIQLRYTSVASSVGSNNQLSRVSDVRYSTNGSTYTTIASYEYLGMGAVVGTDLPVPDIYHNLHDGSGTYDKLDRFNRVTSFVWTKDLSTDVDFYDIDLTYDRVSNITVTDDQIESGWDEAYTYDDLHRLIDMERGTWNGSSIGTDTHGEVWSLSLANGLVQHSLDTDGDGNYTDPGEWDDVRTLNKVNEITGRDTDNDSTDDYSPVFDTVGNLTDDNEAYKYVYDPLGRLIEIKNQSNRVVVEYRYNGLNHQIGAHYDTSGDNQVNGSDVWYAFAYNEKWQRIAVYRASHSSGLIGTIDSDPKQQFVWHMAGMDGRGGSSYIDSMIVEKRDASTNWDATADSTLDADKYAAQNWRHDVVALLTDAGVRIQGSRFDPNGVPTGTPRTDADRDGDVDAADQTIITGGSYDVRGDINLDGALDGSDSAFYTSDQGTTLGREDYALGVDNSQGGGHFNAFTGRKLSFVSDITSWHRNRALRTDLGVWTRRDPLGYVDGPNLYGYVRGPVGGTDPMGLCTGMACGITSGNPVQIPLGYLDWADCPYGIPEPGEPTVCGPIPTPPPDQSPMEPCKMVLVYGFEGFKPGEQLLPALKDAYEAEVSAIKNVRWRYSSYREHYEAASEAIKLYMGGIKCPNGAIVKPKIVVLGFSWGGDSVGKFGDRLKKRDIPIEFAVTLDPVPQVLVTLTGFKKRDNVKKQYNYYQKIADPKGHKCSNCDKDLKMTEPDFADCSGFGCIHMQIPGHQSVQPEVVSEIKLIAQ